MPGMPMMLGKDGIDARILGIPWALRMVWMSIDAMDGSDNKDAWESWMIGKDGMDVRDTGYARDIMYGMDGYGCYGCQ